MYCQRIVGSLTRAAFRSFHQGFSRNLATSDLQPQLKECYQTRISSLCRRFSNQTQNSVDVPAKAKKKGERRRLDELCLTLFPDLSPQLINSYILRGKVKVDDKVVSTPGFQVSRRQAVSLDTSEPKYVCRGGVKLERALEAFQIDVNGKIALDSGQSTGGFTDCLLQHGAKQVIGIDVGFNQLHEKIRNDPRVVAIERFNLRHLEPSLLPDPNARIQIATLDLSFISVLTVLPAVRSVLAPLADVIVLVKPQFEAQRRHVMKGGVVKDPEVRTEVIKRVIEGARLLGFREKEVVESPILGERSGNVEYLLHLTLEEGPRSPDPAVDSTGSGSVLGSTGPTSA